MTGQADHVGAITPDLVQGGPAHAPVCAALHQEAFSTPWSEQAFVDLLAHPTTRVWIAGTSAPVGFVMTRAAADEVEILTLAVRPHQRRNGAGRALVQGALTYAAQHGAARCHLEVAADNDPAKSLYATLGFKVTGSRPGYYARPQSVVDAVLMTKRLK